ncbi:hypothetical protein GMMP15_90075 [Candidatus Magnetomoraceae bacterium gMMP-15]
MKQSEINIMATNNIRMFIPFESLIKAATELSMKYKYQLFKLLEDQIAEAEEELLEQDPSVDAEVQEARAAYYAGDYMTIEEYLEKDYELSNNHT